ncbi:winged helix-turn-helix domain-containing protein [Streptomyces sp. NPDC093595]|uniref:winged helix-turn-helix domain-containing protein n=1 Tax=Streptomyces sp. NPDC093595 TaxID=3366045 RepID=UPI00381FA769
MVEWTGKPAYQQVAEQLRRRIAAGEFSTAGKLPSLAEIQGAYGVTVTVARAAIRQLNSDGLVVTHQGKGAFLTSGSTEAAKLASPEGALADLQDQVDSLRAEVAALRDRVSHLEGDRNSG